MAQTFKNARAVLADTATTVYTCPAGTTAIVIGCQVANVNNSLPQELRFWWTDSSNSNTITYLGYDITIPSKAGYEPLNGKLVLEPGDEIKGLGSSASELEATVSVLELS